MANRRNELRLVALVSGVLFLCSHVAANPIDLDLTAPYGIPHGLPLIHMLLLAMIPEFLMILWLLKDEVPWGTLCIVFVVINTITLPLTLALARSISLLAEGLPLVAEPAMYALLLIRYETDTTTLTRTVISANLLSFVCGIGLIFFVFISQHAIF